MPSRIIREGLLDSERYWSCTIEARELYRHLQLIADDFGCLSLAPVMIRRRCFDAAPSQQKIDGFLNQLADHDLIRIYEVDGSRYAFIPRFGQRLRLMRLKHPRPADALLHGDKDAIEKFSKIIGNVMKLSDISQTDAGQMTAEVKRSEEKRREVEGKTGDATSKAGGEVGQKLLKKIPEAAQPNHLEIERNRRVAQAVVAGDLELAKAIKEGAA